MTYLFYDLETSGLSPRTDRIMQFAGQRTDLSFEPVGEPINTLIKLTSDILPNPEAVMMTGITPQMTLSDGITEAEFLKFFYLNAVTTDTIFLGFNSIRFDDEFMRFLHYRNFYDAYQWQYSDGCSRWDLLDCVRMTRALRPEGIKWPFDGAGAPTNRLELLTKLNHLDHAHAHNALSDVRATISLARLICQKQPKLFEFLLSMRDKRKVASLVLENQSFIYTSGTYPSEFEKTTIVTSLGQLPKKQAALVYDLRHDPSEFLELSPPELAKRWSKWHDDDVQQTLPVKVLQFNRCPAVAPLSVLDKGCEDRLQLSLTESSQNFQKIQKSKKFVENIFKALELHDKQLQIAWTSNDQSVDSQLYNGFLDDHDSKKLSLIRQASPDELAGFVDEIHDHRLKALILLYKARNYPDALTIEEQKFWQAFCRQRLLSGKEGKKINAYLKLLQELSNKNKPHSKAAIIEDLHLYALSLMAVE
ncbi:MAG: exodeoxyribonuclease I [Candidatus Saccharimonadales bacterium]